MSNSENANVHITGKKALTAWNRVSTVLSENGIDDPQISKAIITKLVNDNLLEGDFLVTSVVDSERISIKKLDDKAVVPNFAHATDAGADLVSVEDVTIAPHSRVMVGTGIAIAIPLGKVGLVHPRSGLAAKHGITVLNTPGTIDSGYRGELKVILFNTTDEPYTITVGDRIAQLVIQNHDFPEFVEVDELDDSDRGVNGIGSTGKK